MKVTVGAASDVGKARERNEDSYLAMPPVYIVADGMGGHRGGNVASSIAMQVMSGLANGGNSGMLAEQVRQANHAILERAKNDRDLQGMGTTITATYFENSDLHLAQVGDSRAYLFRGGELSQVTTDHTLVHEMVKRQQITPEEAEHHPQRSILTRALGVDEGIEVDEIHIPAQPADRILLCSDGLHSMVDDAVLEQVLAEEPDPQKAAERLVALANEAGGLDNITVVIMDFTEGDGFEGATWTPPAPPDRTATPVPHELGMDLTSAHKIPAGMAAGAAAEAEAPPMPSVAPSEHDADLDAAPPNPTYQAPSAKHRRGGRRTLLWVVGIVVMLAVAAVGFRLYTDSQYFVGVENGKVAVFRGIPTRTLGVKVFGLVELTDVPAAPALACKQWAKLLHDGDTASSQEDAEAIVAQIRKDLAAGGQCAPQTSGGGGGGGSGSGGSPSSSPT
jgi:protein phosphatase